MWPELSGFDVVGLLPSFVVDTNEVLRQRALRLVKNGVSQKILAAKMGMAPSTFSKWLNRKEGIGAASVTALDGFNKYVQELTAALAQRDESKPTTEPSTYHRREADHRSPSAE